MPLSKLTKCSLCCHEICIRAEINDNFMKEEEEILFTDPKVYLEYLREVEKDDCHIEGLGDIIFRLEEFYKSKGIDIG